MLTKNYFYKTLSLFLSIILSLSLFNFTIVASQNANTISLQRANNVEIIELPADLSQIELTELKSNILKYGNIKLSESEINQINQKASAKGGLVYGKWFGGYDNYYYASISETISFFAALSAVIVPFLADAQVIAVSSADVVSKLLGFIGLGYAIPGMVQAGATVKADIAKRYREVSYSDGTFAYFQTGFFANDLTVDNKYYGSPEAIFSGGLY